MPDFERVFGYNGWANERIFGVAATLDSAGAEVALEGIYGSVGDTARHLLLVEANYLRLMGGPVIELPGGTAPAALAQAASEIDRAYLEFLASRPTSDLEGLFLVPWFEREFTVADGLLQVATHSVEHRADLASALTRLGEKTPPIDYVQWVMAQEPS